MRRILNPRVYITLGLVSLAASVLLASAALGLFPDREAAIRESRISLAEAIAGGSILVAAGALESRWGEITVPGPAPRRTIGPRQANLKLAIPRRPKTAKRRPHTSNRAPG